MHTYTPTYTHIHVYTHLHIHITKLKDMMELAESLSQALYGLLVW